jgi:hypothetical protein
MISVYSTSDGRARCIRFDDGEPSPRDCDMKLVTTFGDDELGEALGLLARLGRVAGARRAKARATGK